MALVESGFEGSIRRAFSGRWIRGHNRTDAEQDEQAGARIAQELKLDLPRTWDGRALAGHIGILERLGMPKRGIRDYAEERITELQPAKRPEASVYGKPVDTAPQTRPIRPRKRKRTAVTVERRESLRDMARRIGAKTRRA